MRRHHERPNHLRLFQEGWEPRSFRDREEDRPTGIAGLVETAHLVQPCSP